MTTQPKIKEPEYHYFKALTNEYTVNPKVRFEKNNIDWTEDISYRLSGNKAYYLKIPINTTTKPKGCKKMYFLKYYPGPNEECILDADAAIFYMTEFPRIKEVADTLIQTGKDLKSWKDLSEGERQYFAHILGKCINDSTCLIAQLDRSSINRVVVATTSEFTQYPEKTPMIDMETFLEEVPNRTTLTINCSKTDIHNIQMDLLFKSPTTYITTPHQKEK